MALQYDIKLLHGNFTPGADAINITRLLNPKKLGNFRNRML